MIIAYILRNANIKKSKNYSYSFLNTSPDPLLAYFFLLQYNLRKSIIMGKAGGDTYVFIFGKSCLVPDGDRSTGNG